TGIGQDRGTFVAGLDPYNANSCAGVRKKRELAEPCGIPVHRRPESQLRDLRTDLRSADLWERRKECAAAAENGGLGRAGLEILPFHGALEAAASRRVLQRAQPS